MSFYDHNITDLRMRNDYVYNLCLEQNNVINGLMNRITELETGSLYMRLLKRIEDLEKRNDRLSDLEKEFEELKKVAVLKRKNKKDKWEIKPKNNVIDKPLLFGLGDDNNLKIW